MTNRPQRYTVTAALLYANGPAHIGHLAGCYIPADVFVRFLRLSGHEVLFVTGSDEHGVPITIKAQKEHCTPKQVVDKYHARIKQTFEAYGISPDIYSRTSSPIHYKNSQDFFNTLYHKGGFTEVVSEQYFDPKAKKFLADRYIVGTCPVCGHDKAYGDQCEKCGSTLSPDELINPYSALSGEKPVKKSTKNWYLPLDTLQKEFLDAYIAQHTHWKPNVYGQCISWLKEGLKPRAMTRDLDWGVPLPLEGTEGKVLYVWFDAPIGYLSMSKELFEKNSDLDYLKTHNISISATGKELAKKHTFEDFWGSSAPTKLVHFIGKDNIVFHCLIFPAMCHVHGGYKIADEVPANEFLNLEGEKISTSRNWAVWADDFLNDMPGKQDAMRYFLLANAPELKDNNFTWKDFQTANNSELVGILGNFINRTLVLTEKYFGGTVPAGSNNPEILAAFGKPFADYLEKNKENLFNALYSYKFREAITYVLDIARTGNKYLADTEPWKIKDQPEAISHILYHALQLVAHLSVFMEPFMPFTAEKLKKIIHFKTNLTWLQLPYELLRAGHSLGKTELLFEKIENEAVEFQIQKLMANKQPDIIQTHTSETPQQPAPNPVSTTKAGITYSQFEALDLRIGTILSAQKVEKADKLLHLTVDLGTEIRSIVSGIAQHYAPDQIIGTQVLVLANLEPRKLKGIESQGMILMAEDSAGSLVFVTPQKNMPSGCEVR